MTTVLPRDAYRWLRGRFLHTIPPCHAGRFPDRAHSIEIVGYFGSPTGEGEGARLCVTQLRRNFSVTCVNVGPSPAADEPWFSERDACSAPAVRILHLNPPKLPRAVFEIGLSRFRSSYNIAYWAWELEEIPDEWQRAIRYVNAVFVPSSFTASAIRKYTGKPVIVVPHLPAVTDGDEDVRTELGIPHGAFVVSSIFTFESFGRKNPLATIEAFREAFPDTTHARLVLKTPDGAFHPETMRRFRAALRGDTRIIHIDGAWPRAKISGLIEASDVYMSLHMSEGYGLCLAEAILRAIPLVATEWSGNTDFCDPDETYAIPGRLVRVEDPHPEYRSMRRCRWADADLGHATRALREIFDDRSAAMSKAMAAKRRLQNYLQSHDYHSALMALRCGY
jgi:hypothetical protein